MNEINFSARSTVIGFGLLACVASVGVQFSSAQTSDPDLNGSDNKPNILLIIGDDMGNEAFSCYGLNDNPANTPTLDNLCNQGVRFDNFWAQPVCSPTRATMLTGRYAFRTGVGRPTGDDPRVMGYWPEKPPKPEAAPREPVRGQLGGRRGLRGAPSLWAIAK